MNHESEKFRQALIKTLYRLRKERGYSHEAIAQKAGVSRQILGKIEGNQTNPTMLTMFRITSAMGMTMAEFMQEMKSDEDKEEE